MRTTVDLDDDVLAAAERRSLGKVLSDLIRRGLAPRPVVRVGPNAGPITAEKVRAALDDDS